MVFFWFSKVFNHFSILSFIGKFIRGKTFKNTVRDFINNQQRIITLTETGNYNQIMPVPNGEIYKNLREYIFNYYQQCRIMSADKN